MNDIDKIKEKIKLLKWMFFDVDGVMTDGSLTYDSTGECVKIFSVIDGQGVKNILKIGINVGLISGRDSPATRKRAEELGIRTLMLGVEDKFKSFNKWKRESQIDEKNCGHMGDDLPDLKLLQMVNLAVAVPDAVPEVKESADYITVKKGGKGAVRELCDLITKYYE
ncbi:MAG: hypothetical protein CBC42_01935 [Betaproteobacteria bacterium TMED82]|nr:MAG: hypothetical protein CBC42_01935 [Betaproteobacteria bacterium TMED82]|tara:strand:- start:1165 stop:1665 length:501 start_codon:yes stop_codon:yes gene_type:complete